MIDHILSHLRLADQFEANAQRIRSAAEKPLRWKEVVLQCDDDAASERAEARVHAAKFGINYADLLREHRMERRVESRLSARLEKLTLHDLLWCASLIRSSPVGSARQCRALGYMEAIASILQAEGALAQLAGWAAYLADQARGIGDSVTVSGMGPSTAGCSSTAQILGRERRLRRDRETAIKGVERRSTR